jgi:ribosomal protein S18 acetylase RimI-like enzyme
MVIIKEQVMIDEKTVVAYEKIEAPTQETAWDLATIDGKCFGSEALGNEEWEDALTELATVFFAKVGSHIVGAAVCKYTMFNIGYLYSTAVLQGYRRMGIATELLQQRIDYLCAGDRNCRIIQAHTRASNIASGRLLQKHNFKAIEYITDYYGDFEDGVLWQVNY